MTSADDITKELGITKNELRNEKHQHHNLSKDELRIAQLLENEGLSFDELVRKTKIDASRLGSLLSMMEIKGIIKNASNGIYTIE